MISFTKMHGLGNDFVVIDATQKEYTLTPGLIRKMSDRRYGIGFDQMLLLTKATNTDADFGYRIFNADGGEAEQCGNGARCMAQFIRQKQLSDKSVITLQMRNGNITVEPVGEHDARVMLGFPGQRQLQQQLQLGEQVLNYHFVNVGNPHMVMAVDHIDEHEVNHLGPMLSTHALFPEGVNVGFLQIKDRGHARLAVYERGAGRTQACGSGACAAMVIGRQLDKLGEVVEIEQAGGSLRLEWQGEGSPIYMTGPTEYVFDGQWKNE